MDPRLLALASLTSFSWLASCRAPAADSPRAGGPSAVRLEILQPEDAADPARRARLDLLGAAVRTRREAHERERLELVEATNAADRVRDADLRAAGGFAAAVRDDFARFRVPDERLADRRDTDRRIDEAIARFTQPCTSPEIVQTSREEVSPGTEFTIEGCAFGDRSLMGSVRMTLDEGFAWNNGVALEIVDWFDDHVRVKVDPEREGVVDQGATLELVRADGAKSAPFPVRFRAARELRVLPGNYLDFQIEHPDTDDDAQVCYVCRPAGGAPVGTVELDATCVVGHFHGCCYPQVTGHDRLTASLINGWSPAWIDLNGVGYVTLELGNQGGNVTHWWWTFDGDGRNGVLQLDVSWWVDHVESGLRCYVLVMIEGPRGTDFADPSRRLPAEACIGEPCSCLR